MITGGSDTIKMVDAYSGELMQPIRPHGSKKLLQACYSPDGSMVIGGDDGGSITLYDAKRGQLVSLFLISKKSFFIIR